MTYFVTQNRQQSGPFDEAAVEAGLREGKYSINDPACREGMTEWRPLGTLFPRYRLAKLITHALKIVAISTVVVSIALIIAGSSDITKATGLTQWVIIFVLHLICLALLFSASKSLNVSTAIFGMIPGALWNGGITIIALSYLFNAKPSPVPSLGSLILLDYWWFSNLYRLLKFKKKFQIEEQDARLLDSPGGAA